jgi:hypothetical protein
VDTYPHALPAFIVLCCCITLLLLFPFASASAHTPTGNGHIYGQLLDGTKNNASLSGQTITLQAAQGETAQDLAMTTTDANGSFSFANLTTDKTISYAVYVRYQGAQYVSNAISLDSQPAQKLKLTVYEATTSRANIAAVQVTVLIHEPNARKQSFTVSESFLFRNLDTHTYVGSFDTSKGKPNALSFSLPPGAGKVTLDQGFDGYQVVQVDRGFATNAALPPRYTEFAFSFDVPYKASAYNFGYDVLYPTVQLSLLVPPSIHTASAALTLQGTTNTNQHTYDVFKTTGLLTNEAVHVQLEGLPTASSADSQQVLNSTNQWLIAALLLALAVLGITGFIYKATRRRAALSSRGVPLRVNKQTTQDRQQALLQELLALDSAYEAGKLSKAAYQEQRAKTKARLRTLMSTHQEASRK